MLLCTSATPRLLPASRAGDMLGQCSVYKTSWGPDPEPVVLTTAGT
jgi:hypothetical protein